MHASHVYVHTCSIPYLQFDHLAVNFDSPNFEIDTCEQHTDVANVDDANNTRSRMTMSQTTQ